MPEKKCRYCGKRFTRLKGPMVQSPFCSQRCAARAYFSGDETVPVLGQNNK